MTSRTELLPASSLIRRGRSLRGWRPAPSRRAMRGESLGRGIRTGEKRHRILSVAEELPSHPSLIVPASPKYLNGNKLKTTKSVGWLSGLLWLAAIRGPGQR